MHFYISTVEEMFFKPQENRITTGSWTAFIQNSLRHFTSICFYFDLNGFDYVQFTDDRTSQL